MELGLITFADMHPETIPGPGVNAHQRIRDLMEEIQLADQLGLDVFGVGDFFEGWSHGHAAFSSIVTLFFIPPRSLEKTLNVLPSR